MSDEKVALRALCLAARIILENGGETYRVEETVMRMAGGLGLREARVVAFPTSLFVTLGTRTITLRVARRGTDLSRLASANDISRHVALGHMDAAEAERAEQEAAQAAQAAAEQQAQAESAAAAAQQQEASAAAERSGDPNDTDASGIASAIEAALGSADGSQQAATAFGDAAQSADAAVADGSLS